MADTKTDELAIATVTCPWRKGQAIAVSACEKCGYHQGREDVTENRWRDELGKTVLVKHGELIRCTYPRVLRVAFVVMGE